MVDYWHPAAKYIYGSTWVQIINAMSQVTFFPYVAMSLFIRPWRHFLQFYKGPRRTSTTFKVAVSHFVFYPCRALHVPFVRKKWNHNLRIGCSWELWRKHVKHVALRGFTFQPRLKSIDSTVGVMLVDDWLTANHQLSYNDWLSRWTRL